MPPPKSSCARNHSEACKWILDGDDVGEGREVWLEAPRPGEHELTQIGVAPGEDARVSCELNNGRHRRRRCQTGACRLAATDPRTITPLANDLYVCLLDVPAHILLEDEWERGVRGNVKSTTHADLESALTSELMRSDPHRVHRALRETAPVYYSAAVGGWLVTSFDLVEEVLTDQRRFSSAGAEIHFIERLDPETAQDTATLRRHFAVPQLNTSDPPDHTRIRRAFGRSFLTRDIARYAGRIQAAADELLANGLRADLFDVISSFAEPLPVRIVSEIIGVPASHQDRIPIVTMDQRYFFGTVHPSEVTAIQFDASLEEWHGLLSGWLRDRLVEPRDDVMTRAATIVDEGGLSRDEAIATLLHFVIAGNGTTTALIGNIIYALASHPEQLDALIEEPDLLSNCIEETLRWEAPLPRDRRIAVEETTLDGIIINKGDKVYSVLAAANRDPAHFADPDTFNIHRSFTTKHHAAFGRGIHFCLGAPVARLEAAIAVRQLLDHIPRLRLAPQFRPKWHDISTHRGLTTLPILTAA